MKKTQNRRVIILSDLKSEYFEQAVFYIKSGAVSCQDLLINEANAIVTEFSRDYTTAKNSSKKITVLKKCTAILGVFLICAFILYIFQ